MTISRPELYARVGINRICFPHYLNFGLPLTPASDFGFRLTATLQPGEAATLTRTYYLKGDPCTGEALHAAVVKARDHWAQMQSAKLGGTKIDGFDDEFPGVAFDYQEI